MSICGPADESECQAGRLRRYRRTRWRLPSRSRRRVTGRGVLQY